MAEERFNGFIEEEPRGGEETLPAASPGQNVQDRPKRGKTGVKVEISPQSVKILDKLAFEAGLPTGSMTKLKESRRRLVEALIAIGGAYLEEKIKRHGLTGYSFSLEELAELAEKVRELVE